jgi:hypothetical protein
VLFVRLQSWRCKPFVDASRRFGLSRLRQKLVSTNPWGYFLGLSPQALCFLNETIFEGSYLFVSAASGHSDPLDPCLRWRPIKNSVGTLAPSVRYRTKARPAPRNPMRICAFILDASIFFHVYHDRAETDFEGEELPDKHAAWRKATITAGQILQSLDGNLTPAREWRMVDEFQNPLFVLHINVEGPK